ncbi:cell division protein SepF [Clostridium sp. CX1]|uniref:Cell division protein SepF n=1 Tax=Clostridium tanneri TaxID=3037988 RepID=A0ABU4JNM4_9CLOT|nr:MULTISPECIES: cell division protein SepF [unclassified Clostridium]MCT8976067.1 cell division protein SepF [Clostridium sp. CX1]MDW8799619.1 cell division protein SepF [Clostridium sp. A1-XYC3]
MAGKVMNRMMGFLGLEDDLEELEESEEREDKKAVNDSVEMEPVISNTKRQNKIVSIHNNISAKIKIVKPTTYDDAVDICDELKNRKIVVINTTGLDPRTAQKLLDFMGGASYALGGDLEEVEKNVYILSPASVEVSNDLKNELSGKGIFSWNK